MEDKYYTESHKKAIDRYDKDFNNTEKNVHNKADSNSKKAYAFAIPAVVIALLLIAFIGIALTGSVKKAVKKSAYSYLDSSSYKELSDYSDEIDALDNKAFDKEYSVLMGVRYYVWSVGFMNTNDSDNYNLTQSDVSNLAYYLSQFYYYTQLSAYKDKEVTMTSDNEKYLNKMQEDMGVLLKKYYHITDEDLDALPIWLLIHFQAHELSSALYKEDRCENGFFIRRLYVCIHLTQSRYAQNVRRNEDYYEEKQINYYGYNYCNSCCS